MDCHGAFAINCGGDALIHEVWKMRLANVLSWLIWRTMITFHPKRGSWSTTVAIIGIVLAVSEQLSCLVLATNLDSPSWDSVLGERGVCLPKQDLHNLRQVPSGFLVYYLFAPQTNIQRPLDLLTV